MPTRILVVAAQKGGVAKTTTAVTIAHGLTLAERAVVLLDMDPQGDVATSLGIPQGPGMYRLLKGEESPTDLIVQTPERRGLGVIPGNRQTEFAQVELEGARISSLRNNVLRRLLNGATGGKTRYIIIDTAPSLGNLQLRALWAADDVIIPTQCDFLSVRGVAQIIRTLEALRLEQDWQGRLLGILPTSYEEVTRETKAGYEDLHRAFPGRILAPIHEATIIRESTSRGQTVFEYAPKSRAADEYRQLVKTILATE